MIDMMSQLDVVWSWLGENGVPFTLSIIVIVATFMFNPIVSAWRGHLPGRGSDWDHWFRPAQQNVPRMLAFGLEHPSFIMLRNENPSSKR